jgi:hypothetical protein
MHSSKQTGENIMGTYVYTRRAETKTIAGVTIGRFAFAYKYSRFDGWYPGGKNRTVRIMESFAAKAAEKTPNVEFFVIGDFERAAACNSLVYQMPKDVEYFVEEPTGAKVVGTLRKVGRKFVLSTLI